MNIMSEDSKTKADKAKESKVEYKKFKEIHRRLGITKKALSADSFAKLDKSPFKYHVFSKSHIRIYGPKCNYDLYPTTGKWINLKDWSKGRYIDPLMDELNKELEEVGGMEDIIDGLDLDYLISLAKVEAGSIVH